MKAEENYKNFRLYLQSEYRSRVQKNPSYSLRSFAKYLDINDSTLSKILRGELKITKKRFQVLSQKFSFSFDELRSMSQNDYNNICEENLKILEDWINFAILELVKTSQFQSSPKWIAQRLNCNENEVKISLNNLLNAKYILIDKNKNYNLCSANNSWNGDHTDALKNANRRLQKQFIEKSLETLFHVSAKEKENASLTVACNRKLLPEVKKKIHAFKMELDNFIMNSADHDDVYQLNISFFPITEKLKEPRNE